MNSVRLGDEYWFKPVLRPATLTPLVGETNFKHYSFLKLHPYPTGTLREHGWSILNSEFCLLTPFYQNRIQESEFSMNSVRLADE